MSDEQPAEQKSDVVTVKEFFGMTSKEAIVELKTLPSEDRRQLAEGIRNDSLTY